MTTTYRRGVAAVTLAAALLLPGCASGTGESEAARSKQPDPAEALSIDDAWVKTADAGMTAIFGDLKNSGDDDLTVASASCELSAMELHEVVGSGEDAKMRPKEGGFVVPAGEDHPLEPGGDHLMLMDLSEPVKAGDEIDFTLVLADGTEVELTAVAKDFAGGDEEYDDGKDKS